MSILLDCNECSMKPNPGCSLPCCKRQSAIHAVQYLIGKCDNPEHIPDNYVSRENAEFYDGLPMRANCPLCMAKVNEVLGISQQGEKI